MIEDIFSLIYSCVDELIKTREEFFLLMMTAVVIAVGLWIFAANYTRLWNKAFKNRPIHYCLFTLSAIMTFIFIIVFYSLKFTDHAAEYTVIKWEYNLKNDNKWSNDVFIKAYEAVDNSGKADMSNYKHPDNGGKLIPSQHKVRPIIAEVYSNESIAHFKKSHTLLSRVLWANSRSSNEKIQSSMDAFFVSNPGEIYTVKDAIEIAAKQISLGLKEQTPRVVYVTRIILVLLFFIFQLIAFGIVGFHAYNDLKLKT